MSQSALNCDAIKNESNSSEKTAFENENQTTFSVNGARSMTSVGNNGNVTDQTFNDSVPKNRDHNPNCDSSTVTVSLLNQSVSFNGLRDINTESFQDHDIESRVENNLHDKDPKPYTDDHHNDVIQTRTQPQLDDVTDTKPRPHQSHELSPARIT